MFPNRASIAGRFTQVELFSLPSRARPGAGTVSRQSVSDIVHQIVGSQMPKSRSRTGGRRPEQAPESALPSSAVRNRCVLPKDMETVGSPRRKPRGQVLAICIGIALLLRSHAMVIRRTSVSGSHSHCLCSHTQGSRWRTRGDDDVQECRHLRDIATRETQKLSNLYPYKGAASITVSRDRSWDAW